jgi:hypothetical protein
VTPTPEITEQPSVSAEPPSTAQPSLAAIEDFGATDLLFTDDFSDPTSGWGVGTNAGGSVAYTDGALEFILTAVRNWEWSPRETGSTSNVVHVEASFSPLAAGYQGLLCANGADDLWGAVANADGQFVFISLTSNGSTLLDSGQQDGFQVPDTGATVMALDCAGTTTGAFRMQLSFPAIGLATTYEGETGQGPVNFDRVGIYAESGAEGYALRVDDLSAYGGSGGSDMSPAATALLAHVPAAWRDDCFESPSSLFEQGAEATLTCLLSGDTSDFAEYTQFDTKANMDAAYQTRVDQWATDTDVQSCDTGPDEAGYNIGGQPAGRILCAPQTTGTRLDWTHDALLILGTLTDFDGSYPDMYADWQVAGPD